MEEIEVAAPNEEAVIFPCRCWLAEDEGDGKTARDLEPGETVNPPYDSEYILGKHTAILFGKLLRIQEVSIS